MLEQALALANHPMRDYIRVGFTTTRKGNTPAAAITWEKFAMGGCEIHYITADGGVLCHTCANDNKDQTLLQEGEYGFTTQWGIISADVNYESTGIHCDHCGREIEPEHKD